MDVQIVTGMDKKDLLSEFECPVCTNYMLPPLYQCQNGHCFCSACFPKIPKCPICRAPKSFNRCYTLEKIQTFFVFPCIYESEGCDFQATSPRIAQHQQKCKFGTVPCPLRFNDCDWQGEKSEVISHCRKGHKRNIYFNSKQSFTSTGFVDIIDRIYYIVFNVHNNLFRCTWDLDKETGMMRFAVYRLSSSNERRYFYEMSFLWKDTIENFISVKAPCYYMEDDFDRFLDNKYFTLPHEQVKELCDEEGNLNYHVNIYENERPLV